MSRDVPHMRPELTDTFRVAVPVASYDWGGLASLAHFSNGHGGMLIPWTSIGHTVSSGATGTFLFFVAPKLPCVERVFRINMHASAAAGVTAAVVVGGAASQTREVFDLRNGRINSYVFRESLGSKTNTAAEVSVKVTAAGGNVIVESISMYEQTRGVLDATTDDFPADIDSLRSRDPIYDAAFESLAGVMDGYKNLDARRAGFFHWSTDAAGAITTVAAQGAPDTVFPLSIPMAGAIPTLGDATTSVVCAVNCKVTAGTGTVRFQSDDAGDSVNVDQTGTSFSWVTGNLTINCEDFSVTDGRRGSTWEGVAVDTWVTATDTLTIQAISIYRTTTPL